MNEVNIEEQYTTYDVELLYHSDKKCQNFTAKIEAVENADGTIDISPTSMTNHFEFMHSDPDRVIAIAQMMMAFAQMVKNNNKKAIDINDKL